MDNLHVRLKAGDREFEATGSAAVVEKHLQAAREWMREAPFRAPRVPESLSGPGTKTGPPDHIALFSQDADHGRLRLLALPPSRQVAERLAKALLLLIYGYKIRLGDPAPAVTSLAEDLRLSGLSALRRLSRAFDRLEASGHAVRSGRGKGTRYRLTGPGLQAAEQLADLLLGLPGSASRQDTPTVSRNSEGETEP